MNQLEFMEEDTKQKILTMFEKYGQEKFFLSFSGGRDSTILSAFSLFYPSNQTKMRKANKCNTNS